jgi:hypothetical protein
MRDWKSQGEGVWSSASLRRASRGQATVVMFYVRLCQELHWVVLPFAGARHDVSWPSRRLHRLELAREGLHATEIMVLPALEGAGIPAYPPFRDKPATIDIFAEMVDRPA